MPPEPVRIAEARAWFAKAAHDLREPGSCWQPSLRCSVRQPIIASKLPWKRRKAFSASTTARLTESETTSSLREPAGNSFALKSKVRLQLRPNLEICLRAKQSRGSGISHANPEFVGSVQQADSYLATTIL